MFLWKIDVVMSVCVVAYWCITPGMLALVTPDGGPKLGEDPSWVVELLRSNWFGIRSKVCWQRYLIQVSSNGLDIAYQYKKTHFFYIWYYNLWYIAIDQVSYTYNGVIKYRIEISFFNFLWEMRFQPIGLHLFFLGR